MRKFILIVLPLLATAAAMTGCEPDQTTTNMPESAYLATLENQRQMAQTAIQAQTGQTAGTTTPSK